MTEKALCFSGWGSTGMKWCIYIIMYIYIHSIVCMCVSHAYHVDHSFFLIVSCMCIYIYMSIYTYIYIYISDLFKLQHVSKWISILYIYHMAYVYLSCTQTYTHVLALRLEASLHHGARPKSMFRCCRPTWQPGNSAWSLRDMELSKSWGTNKS